MVVHPHPPASFGLSSLMSWFGSAASSIFCNAVPCSSPTQTCGFAFSETFQRSLCGVCPVRASHLHKACWNLLHPSMTKCAWFNVISHLWRYILSVICFDQICAEQTRYHGVQANLFSGGRQKQAPFRVFFWFVLFYFIVQSRSCEPQKMNFQTPLLQTPPFA